MGDFAYQKHAHTNRRRKQTYRDDDRFQNAEVHQIHANSADNHHQYGRHYNHDCRGFHQGTQNNHDDHDKEYDYIIIATPLQDDISGIKFINIPSSAFTFKNKYHRTVATFVCGFPNVSHFGYESFEQFPDEMFTSDSNLLFNSIGRQSPVDYSAEKHDEFTSRTPVFKVFSQTPLSQDQLHLLFSEINEVKVVDWTGAYPAYAAAEDMLPPFELHPGMFYVNAIEIAASAMEMLAIGGRNAALLVFNQLNNQPNLIDPDFPSDQVKTEL
jgi:prenylcysteine oxidase/farnesylcysteine lyase